MRRTTRGRAVAIYIAETDHFGGKPLYAAIVESAKQSGLSGATVERAVMGYGAHSKIHTTNILSLSEDLPVVVTLVDTAKKIEDFLVILEKMVVEGAIISWDVEIDVFRKPEA